MSKPKNKKFKSYEEDDQGPGDESNPSSEQSSPSTTIEVEEDSVEYDDHDEDYEDDDENVNEYSIALFSNIRSQLFDIVSKTIKKITSLISATNDDQEKLARKLDDFLTIKSLFLYSLVSIQLDEMVAKLSWNEWVYKFDDYMDIINIKNDRFEQVFFLEILQLKNMLGKRDVLSSLHTIDEHIESLRKLEINLTFFIKIE